MIYKHGELPKKPKRWIWRTLLMIIAVLYSFTVYNWWLEGNKNFETQRLERANANIQHL